VNRSNDLQPLGGSKDHVLNSAFSKTFF